MLAPAEAEWAADRLSIPRSTVQQDARSSPENKVPACRPGRRQLISHGWTDPARSHGYHRRKNNAGTDFASHSKICSKRRAR